MCAQKSDHSVMSIQTAECVPIQIIQSDILRVAMVDLPFGIYARSHYRAPPVLCCRTEAIQSGMWLTLYYVAAGYVGVNNDITPLASLIYKCCPMHTPPTRCCPMHCLLISAQCIACCFLPDALPATFSPMHCLLLFNIYRL